jgi:hypothetical protein
MAAIASVAVFGDKPPHAAAEKAPDYFSEPQRIAENEGEGSSVTKGESSHFFKKYDKGNFIMEANLAFIWNQVNFLRYNSGKVSRTIAYFSFFAGGCVAAQE